MGFEALSASSLALGASMPSDDIVPVFFVNEHATLPTFADELKGIEVDD
jgi:hypothetical protein